jgi:hypothetical protein
MTKQILKGAEALFGPVFFALGVAVVTPLLCFGVAMAAFGRGASWMYEQVMQ